MHAALQIQPVENPKGRAKLAVGLFASSFVRPAVIESVGETFDEGLRAQRSH